MILTRRFTLGTVALLTALPLGILSACGSAVTGTSGPPGPLAVQVRPEAPRVEPGGAVDFDATVAGVLNTAVVWSVREVAGGSVDGTGLYTAPLSSGTYHVVATIGASPPVEGVATVTVTEPPALTYAISGTISPAGSGAGTPVTLSGTASQSTTTDGSGNYAFGGLVNGSYTVTPSRTAHTFTPASRVVTVSGADVGRVDFTVTPPAQIYAISGTIAPAAGGAGATVTLSGGASATSTADAGGNFRFSGLSNGSYAVTPSKAGSVFTPPSRSVTVSGADVTGLAFTISTFSANLTMDGSRTFQTIDGMGTSINVESWKGGELIPALDFLVDVNGASLLRVVRDPMDWVGNESDIRGLHDKDPATLARIYEMPRMKDLWSTISYLNQKGLRGGQVYLNFMGWTPTWMGGSGAYGSPSYINPGKEGAFATMVASLVYYGRVVKGLDFTNVSPMNEADWDAKEGPSVGAGQYTAVLEALANELTWYGLDDVRIVGPDTSSSGAGYITQMMGNSTVSGRVDHLAFHNYSGGTSPGTGYPGKNYWLTETAVWCSTCDQNGAPPSGEWAFARDNGALLLQDIANGFPAVLIWEGYDSFWYHHDNYSTWGLLAYNRATGVYTPRKRFYVNSQLTRFIRPGMKRTSLTSSIANLTALAFHDAAGGKVAIVGRNAGGSSVTLNGQLNGMPAAVTSLAVFLTDSGSRNLQRIADVPVSGNTFSVTIPADTFFSLAN